MTEEVQDYTEQPWKDCSVRLMPEFRPIFIH